MKNFIQPGDNLTLVAPSGGVVSGGVYQIGQLLVVAAADAAQGADFVGRTHGVFKVTKVGSQAWTEGALVYFDKENARFTTTASGSLLAGHAVRPLPGSGAGETTGHVHIKPMARADEA